MHGSYRGTSTALGDCRLETPGHLVPCDSRHAPIKHYRTYGEWWEAGKKEKAAVEYPEKKTSRFWPYGEDVTKIYQTTDRVHQYRLDDRTIQNARIYIPQKSGSLPDLRSFRNSGEEALSGVAGHGGFHLNRGTMWPGPVNGGSQYAEPMDAQYHRTFQSSLPPGGPLPLGRR